MKRVCCSCKKYLGEKPGPKDAVTHGFCDPCLKIYRAEMLVALENVSPTDHPSSPLAMAGKHGE